MKEALQEEGLLHNLEPRDYLTPEIMEAYMGEVLEAIDSARSGAGAIELPDLDLPTTTLVHIGGYTFGRSVDGSAAREFIAELNRRGLIVPPSAGARAGSQIRFDLSRFPDPDPGLVMAWSAFVISFTIAAHIKQEANRKGLGLHTVASMGSHQQLANLLRKAPASQADIVNLDMEGVGVDLALVPLTDVLAFRTEHGAAYRAYAANVRSVASKLLMLDEAQRERYLHDRQEEIRDAARDLRKASSTAFGLRSAKLLLGLLATVAASKAGPLATVLTGGSAALQLLDSRENPSSSYRYVFAAETTL